MSSMNPQFGQMMQNPGMRQLMSNPNFLRSTLQMQAASGMGGGGGGAMGGGFGGFPPQAAESRSAMSGLDFSSLLIQSPALPTPVSTGPTESIPPAQRFALQVDQTIALIIVLRNPRLT
jgi:hypothetical protein